MTSHPTPAGVRLVGQRLRPHRFVVFVRDTDGADEIRVRVLRKPAGWTLYRCDACGDADRPHCPHSLAAHRLFNPTK